MKYKEACGGSLTTTFDDLLTIMPRQAVHALARTYDRVEDVDLFVGGLVRRKEEGRRGLKGKNMDGRKRGIGKGSVLDLKLY